MDWPAAEHVDPNLKLFYLLLRDDAFFASVAVLIFELQSIQARHVLAFACPPRTPALGRVHDGYHAREIGCTLVLDSVHAHANALLTVVTPLLLKLHASHTLHGSCLDAPESCDTNLARYMADQFETRTPIAERVVLAQEGIQATAEVSINPTAY